MANPPLPIPPLAQGQAPIDADPLPGGIPPPIVPADKVPPPGSEEFEDRFLRPNGLSVRPKFAPDSPRISMNDHGNPAAMPAPPANQVGMQAFQPPPEAPKPPMKEPSPEPPRKPTLRTYRPPRR